MGVSNDNPFQESHFKTMKYQPDYPGRFGSVDHARAWLQEFFRWHNNDHHHSGLALFTPAEVFFERVSAVHAVRQEALDVAFNLNPARFPNGAPKAALPPQRCTSTRSRSGRYPSRVGLAMDKPQE